MNRSRLFGAACSAMFLFGIVLAMLGTIFGLQEMRDRLHVDLAQQGDIFLALFLGVGLLPIAVVGFIVQDQDILQTHQFRHHALNHLPLGFKGIQLLAAPLQQGTPAFGEFKSVPQLEGVVIRDDDLGPLKLTDHIARD